MNSVTRPCNVPAGIGSAIPLSRPSGNKRRQAEEAFHNGRGWSLLLDAPFPAMADSIAGHPCVRRLRCRRFPLQREPWPLRSAESEVP